jgi:hypothetical protein
MGDFRSADGVVLLGPFSDDGSIWILKRKGGSEMLTGSCEQLVGLLDDAHRTEFTEWLAVQPGVTFHRP